MTDREMYYLIGKCLALDEHPEFRDQLIALAKSELIDWHQFVSLCSNHLVLPAIFLKFRTHNLLDHLPEDLTSHLHEVHALNVARNTRILKQLHEIVDVLKPHKIYPVFLKGAANLLDGLYADLGERILGDIDFLVSDDEYLEAARLMKDAGYAEAYETPDYKDIETFKHYPRLFHPEHGATIEIHRIPVDEVFTGWFNNETIARERQLVAELVGCYVPSARHRLIHNFIHGPLSNQDHLFGRMSLRGAYDLYLLSKKFPPEQALAEIKPKQKAIAYFALVRRVLGLDLAFFPKSNLAYRILYIKHTLNLSSTLFNQAHRNSLFLGERIFKGYLGQIIEAFYSREKRNYLSRRIINRQWYGDHFRLYSRFFAKHK
ncbi:nucleotidyltransferase family protein [Sunxiuqinia dokdonensis]|uniref:Nucleotidyltransferase family protein n=1 Tax=Sunxiuqinia dokdonensis TaxID=1409788 RepID=A0A0L8V883_9BACT|nr:nucleotidyltransferase family protein [Sunxiuqinia dokdonensis]KOH44639.1 hypothetical protein NC99_25470 [Sunxiuqinia dokdonensis]